MSDIKENRKPEKAADQLDVKKKGKTKLIIIIVAALVIIAVGCVLTWYFGFQKPYEEAVVRFTVASETVVEKNNEFDIEIEKAQALIDSDPDPWNPVVVSALKDSIEDAINAKRLIPDMPEKTAEINKTSDFLESILDYSGFITDMNEKQKTINDSVTIMSLVKEKNEDLTRTIYSATDIIQSGDIPLDESTLTELQDAVDEGNSVIRNTMENLDRTQEPIIDYSSIKSDTERKIVAFQNSINQYKLVDIPSEEYVISCLRRIPDITALEAATEETDPNGVLGKPGSYIAVVYFEDPRVVGEAYGNTITERATDGGGAVEVFANAEDAQTRADYLASFQGQGFLDPGSVRLLGTTVVRTSSNLRHSQQVELEQKIVDELIRLG